jgi:hypothetical protein
MQNQSQALSHIGLVFSQLPMNILHSLHTSFTQEIQFCAELTSMELAKDNEDNATLHTKYNKLLE